MIFNMWNSCKHVFRFVINLVILFIILPMSLYYQNTLASMHVKDHYDVYSEICVSVYSSRTASQSLECASYEVQLPKSFY